MKTHLVPIAILAAQLHLLADEPAPGPADYVAHEWGTFTSVQGADGQLLSWNPLTTSNLPAFVYDRNRPWAGLGRDYGAGKAALFALQRMETPVIYFYAGQPLTVDVTVRFPKGIVSEWYPYAGRVGPSRLREADFTSPDGLAGSGGAVFGFALDGLPANDHESVIRWPQVEVLAGAGALEAGKRLMTEASGSHYYAARETEANTLRVENRVCGIQQQEKFLFYRGVGSFATPVRVNTSGAEAEHVTITNTGTDALTSLLVLRVQDGQGAMWPIKRVAPGEPQSVTCDWNAHKKPLPTLVEELAGNLRHALEEQGLFAAEARAMVETWRDSWLEEQGVRVLYLLPRSWTDETLPLTLEPRPRQVERVMVGRAEIITPGVESRIRQQIVCFNGPDANARTQAVVRFRALQLGRFAEPAVRRVADGLTAKELKDAAWRMLEEAGKTRTEKGLAGL